MTRAAPSPEARTSPLRRLLEDGRPHLMDGAMGTMLYERGVFLNVCYDELNQTRPDLVTSIHQAYLEAGAEILETNTFGANPVKLSAFRLEDQTEAINAAGVQCAKEAIRRHKLDRGGELEAEPCVVGAIGPLGLRIEPWGATSFEEARHFFGRQIEGLIQGGVDGFLLETFQDLGELEQAVLAIRDRSDLPIMTQMTLADGGQTALGTPVAQIVDTLDSLGVDAVGFNCSAGPAEVLEAVEEASERTQLPILAQPNAGLPRSVGDRTIYLASPEYMARYARRMLGAGAKFLGGCCGTTPDHIREIGLILGKTQTSSHSRFQLQAEERGPSPQLSSEPNSLQNGLDTSHDTPGGRVTDTLLSLLGGSTWVRCVECSPHPGWHPDALLVQAKQLRQAGAHVVAIPDAPRGVATLPPAIAALLVQEAVGILALPHFTARDRILMDMVSDLMGLAAGRVHQVLLKSGDPSSTGPYPDPSRFSEVDAIGLTHAVQRLNIGMAPGGGAIEPPCPLAPGVRLNQVSPDPIRAQARYRYKVEAGAAFAITQPVYEPRLLRTFLENSPEHRVPVLAVLRPLTSAEEAEFLANEVPGHAIPRKIRARMAEAEAQGGLEAAQAEGLQIALETLDMLMSGAPWTSSLRGIYLAGAATENQVRGVLEAIRRKEMQKVSEQDA